MKKNDIYVIYGADANSMVKRMLENIEIEDEIPQNALIGIKPNLAVSKPASHGATTHVELIEGIIEHLNSKGFYNIVILEGSWIGDSTSRAFKACGYELISKKYNVPLYDLQKDNFSTYAVEDLKINVCNKVMELDFLINVPVLKGHCQTGITCALKNLKGCIPDIEKRRFHSLGLHKPIALLNKIIKTDLVIVDGICGDLDFEEGGNPVQMNRIISGLDPVLIDSYAAQLLGFNINEIPYITLAEKAGIGISNFKKSNIIELNKDTCKKNIISSRKAERLTKYIEEKNACSACYGSLIHALHRLNQKGKLLPCTEKLYIGQGFKNIIADGIGIGNCTKRCNQYVPGCPPNAKDIIDFIIKNSS